MARSLVLGMIEVMENGPRSEQCQRPVIKLKALQALVFKLLLNAFSRVVRLEHPIIQTADVPVTAKGIEKSGSLILEHEHFGWLVGAQEAVDQGLRSLCCCKITRRNIEQRQTIVRFFPIHGCQVIIRASVENLVVKRNSGSDQFRDPSLDDSDCFFRVLKLIANRNAVTGSHQFWKVRVQ